MTQINHIFRTIFYVMLMTLWISVPMVAFGQREYIPIQPLPGIPAETDLATYIGQIINIIIAVGIILGVLMFSFGGLQYMASEVITEKGKAREQMESAVIGILILLGTWLILFLINPDLVELNFLRSVGSGD